MKYFFCFLWLCTVQAPTLSQSTYEVDSLNHIAESYWYSQSDSVIKYGKQALALSHTIDYIYGRVQAHTSLCFGHYLKSQNDSSEYHGLLALSISEQQPGAYNLTNAHIFLGLNKMSLGVNHEAIGYFQKALELAQNSNNNFALADASSNIGLAFTNSKNYPKAKQYYRAAMKVHDNIDHPHGKVYILHNLGRIFFETQYYDSARYYLKQTVTLSTKINDKRAKYYALSLLGQIPETDLRATEEYLKGALQLAYELNMTYPIMENHIWLSNFYLNQTKYRLAIQHAKNALDVSGDSFFHIKKDAYANMVKAYSSLDDYESSSKYVLLYENALDSLKQFNKSHASGVLELSELTDEAQDVDSLRRDLENIRIKNQLQNMIILLGLVILALAAILIVMQYRAIQKKKRSADALVKLNDQLDHAMKEKDLILGMVVHDLKSPLDKIHGLTEIIKGKMNLDQEDREMIDLMQQIIFNSKNLTAELLEVNQLETGNYNVKNELLEVKSFVDSVLFHFENDAGKKGIAIIPTYELQKGIIRSDKAMLQRILENLLTNAIKFNPMNGKVFVNVSTDEMTLTISVHDTGPGIPKHEHGKLFQKFSRTSTQPTAKESSTGLGLYIVKHLVNNLSGSITVHSDTGQGAEFLIHIPLN